MALALLLWIERGFRSNPNIPFFSLFMNSTKSLSLQESANLIKLFVMQLVTSSSHSSWIPYYTSKEKNKSIFSSVVQFPVLKKKWISAFSEGIISDFSLPCFADTAIDTMAVWSNFLANLLQLSNAGWEIVFKIHYHSSVCLCRWDLTSIHRRGQQK